MFNYWAHLTVKLRIPGLEPLAYVGQVDDNGTGLFSAGFETPAPAEIPVSVVIRCIESLFANIEGLPFVFRHLFLYGGLSFEACVDMFRRHMGPPPGHDVLLAFNKQPIEELLVQAIALKHTAIVARERMLGDQADLSFRHALQQVWVVQAQQTPQALPFRLLFVIMLLYLYGRPHHALGILQNLEPLVWNTAPKPHDSPATKAQYEAYLYLYFILERYPMPNLRYGCILMSISDILSEIDGVPSDRLHTVIVAALNRTTAVTVPQVLGNEPIQASVDNYQSLELQTHLQLRAYMNTILEHMYSAQRAYCRPDEVAGVITEIGRRLDLWYWNLPLNLRFPRHPSSFRLASNNVSHLLDELRFRYYATIFLVNRPILYHVLHARYQNAVSATNATNAGPSVQDPILDPWVYESCHNCVQNATMIILLHSKRHETTRHEYFESWSNLQHLIAAYAIILQVQASAISILLQGYGDPEQLLDLADAALEHGLNRPPNVRESLGILRHIRENFRRDTPRTPSSTRCRITSPVQSVASHQSQPGSRS
ncbi:uncharacterized protein Z520_11125 [Fonsecaea multimorphosa CBS 102226]|uniref:Transcription factor domain-containing protein n=1 Tax=Fonsecaea multimorphosa CBS 102226 TaxID=1442371 RepID=A0A0D2K9J3_9EURO|nr:uncharacterized protein Z520_11125 [Fonsecaea multimorphosa CBS 102226]KIX93068.1 hypothetical protein Z520_11125 [Fonsecaea multimorphosa CBS 102226]